MERSVFLGALCVLVCVVGLACAVRPAVAGTTERVSVASDGTEANGWSYSPSISADGLFVAFESDASNLAPVDTNASTDIFVHGRQTGQTTRVSVASDGSQGNGNSSWPCISADGRFVAFHSSASNLVAGDTNETYDVFLHDRQTGQTTRVSVASGGTQGNGSSLLPSVSGDGRFVAFYSDAGNLVPVDTNASTDIFVHDRQTGQTTRVSVASDGTQGNGSSYYPSISDNGRFVAFFSFVSNLVAGDTNGTVDIFVHDRQTGQTTRVSVASDGAQGRNGSSYYPAISGDGRFVAFQSRASNLVAGDTNETYNVFVHDRQTGQTTRVSVASDGTQENSGSYDPSISADGRFVGFVSHTSNLVPGDTNKTDDVFVHDRQTGQTTRVNVAPDGAQGNDTPLYHLDFCLSSISADGRFVTFESDADNLVAGDTNGYRDIFVRDRQTDLTVASTPTGVQIAGDKPGLTPYTATCGDQEVVSLSAPPTMTTTGDVDYDFVRWIVGALNQPEGVTSIQITMVADHTAVALYQIQTHTLTVTTSGNGTGAVDLDPPGGVYDDGTTVTLTAQPSPGSAFGHWEADLTGSANPTIILMDHDKTIVAYFTRPRLAVLSAPIIDVAMGGTYAGQTPYAADLDYAETVNLTAPASVSVGDSDYPFACWFVNGQQQEEGQTLELMMDGDKAAVAQYDWRLPGDLTGDCAVTILDMIFVRNHLYTSCSE